MKLLSFFNALCSSESSHSRRESTEAEGGSTYKAAGWLGGCGSVGVWPTWVWVAAGEFWDGGGGQGLSQGPFSAGALFLSSPYTLRLGAMTQWSVVETKN